MNEESLLTFINAYESSFISAMIVDIENGGGGRLITLLAVSSNTEICTETLAANTSLSVGEWGEEGQVASEL